MKKMLSFGFATLFTLIGTAEEIASSTIDSDIENNYGENPYGTVCQMSSFLQKTATLKWCSLGTSITWYNDEPRPEVGLTRGYQDRTIEKLGLNKAANFINRGVSGARIGDANTEPPSGSPCDIYTLEWGINDWMRGTRVGNLEIFRRRLANPNDSCEDITTEVWYTFAASYALLIRQIKAVNPDAIIILMTPRKAFNNNNNLNNSMAAHWWDKSTPDSGQQEATYLYDYVKLIRAIGEEIHCPVVDQFRYAANVENLESLSIDKALHPNDAGYEVMANLLAPVMSQAIETKYGITRCTHEGTTSVVPGTAATCTSDGTKDKTVCTNPDCQMVIIPSETIPALGHAWGAWTVTTPATESATGLKRHECSRCDAYEEQVIPRVGEIVALRNIAVVTKVGELPVLPAQVAGLRADGTVAGLCDVVWAAHDAPSAIGKSTITGTATVDNEAMAVTASVRATVEQSDDDIKNIVFGVPPTTAYPMSGITYNSLPGKTELANQVNGYYEQNSLAWYGALGVAKDGDYNGKFAKEVFVFEFTLAKTATVKGFSVWHDTDVQNWLMDPITAFAEVSTDNGTTWTSVAVTGGAKPKSVSSVPTASGSASVFKYDYELAAPAASVTNLRLKFSPYGIETPEPGDSSNWKGLKIAEIEVFGIEGESGGPLEPLTTDTLSALEVDNAAVPGFAPTTLSYTIDEALDITSATSTDNMGITILPRANGAAHVVTLSESGSTKTYTVNMPAACEHVNTTVVPAVAATCTTAGSTQSVYCEDCKKYLETSTEVPALGHDWDEWTVTKEPSKTETGYREHTCKRTGCGITEGEDIPKLTDVVALRNVAVVTAVGSAPELPAKVAGLKPDGTVGGEYDVVWNEAAAPTVAGISTVTGTAQVNGAPMSVTAFVRAVSATPVNYSSSANPTTTSNIIKGTINNNGKLKYLTTNAEDPLATDNTWNDVICYGNIVEVTLEWSSEVTATKVRVYFVVSGVNYIPPSDVKFYSGDDFSEEIEWTEGDSNHNGGNESWHEYVFTTPQKLSKLKFYQQSDKVNTNKALFMRRLWVQGGGSVDPQTADTLTALEVDDEAVQLQDGVYTYEVIDGQAITKATNNTDNVAVTILPKYDYKAYAVTLAEDGESTETYTVSMPKSHDHTFGEWQVITPATVYAPGLRRRVCTFAGCEVKEEEEIPQIPRKTVKWVDVDFANYTDGSAIANGQVDPVNGGTWAKPDADDTATVAHGDVNLAALVVTNQYLCYAAKAQTSAGRDAMVEFKAKFQKPNTDTLPPALDLGQTAVFVFPDGKGSCYKAYTSTGWVKLTGATPDFEKFVTIKIEVRYNDGGRSAMVTIDNVVCTPVGATSPWFSLAGEATKLTSVNFFGEFDLGPFWGEYLAEAVRNGFLIIVK